MFLVMEQEKGVGLAANQIGLDISMFVLCVDGHKRICINPFVANEEELVEFEEGCLSIPGVSAKTKRYNKLSINYLLPDGKLVSERVEGMTAIAIQHEMDHLDGKLYIDQLGPLKRSMVIKKFEKNRR